MTSSSSSLLLLLGGGTPWYTLHHFGTPHLGTHHLGTPHPWYTPRFDVRVGGIERSQRGRDGRSVDGGHRRRGETLFDENDRPLDSSVGRPVPSPGEDRNVADHFVVAPKGGQTPAPLHPAAANDVCEKFKRPQPRRAGFVEGKFDAVDGVRHAGGPVGERTQRHRGHHGGGRATLHAPSTARRDVGERRQNEPGHGGRRGGVAGAAVGGQFDGHAKGSRQLFGVSGGEEGGWKKVVGFKVAVTVVFIVAIIVACIVACIACVMTVVHVWSCS